MIFNSKQKKLQRLLQDVQYAHCEYLKFLKAHSKHIACSPMCNSLMNRKKKAKKAWLVAELSLVEFLDENQIYLKGRKSWKEK